MIVQFTHELKFDMIVLLNYRYCNTMIWSYIPLYPAISKFIVEESIKIKKYGKLHNAGTFMKRWNSADQQIPRFCEIQVFHIHKNPPLDPTMRQLNPLQYPKWPILLLVVAVVIVLVDYCYYYAAVTTTTIMMMITTTIWGSSVSIVSDYRLDDQGSIPGRGREFFLLPLRPDQLWGPSSLLSNGYQGPFLGVKRNQGVTLTTHPL
jgi:hypothetical protein